MLPLRVWRASVLILGIVGGRVSAQSVERPVPFDTAGRVLTITPRFVTRFKVGAPWAVSGDFVEARLFARSEGGFVLVVQRADGALERSLLAASERDALAAAIWQSLAAVGGVATIGEGASIISQPAGGAFTRNLTIAGALIWGPAVAALIDDYPAGAAAYLGTVGAAFFASSAIAKSAEISRAQNHLASDGALRGAALGSGLAYLIEGEEGGGRGTALAVLGGSLAATAAGFTQGRNLSDGESHGATWGSTYAGGLAAGVIGLADGWKSSENKGGVAGVMLGALAGYPAGLQWVRRSKYAITAGDVGAITTASLIGVVGAATLLGDGSSNQAVAGALSGGLVIGSLVGARSLAKPHDLTESQSTQLNLGAVAGGLIGIALPTLAQADDGRAYAGAGAIGAALGMAVTTRLLDLRPGAGRSRAVGDSRVRVTPWNAVGLFSGPTRPGDPAPRRASLVSVQFR
jgi:hypothetical protein